MSEKVTAAIVLTTYKRPHLLNWGLHSLTKQKADFPWEILVLNDGLKDESESICERYKKQGLNVRYIFTGERNYPTPQWRVPGYALNIGVKLTDAEVIILSCAEMYHMDEHNVANMVKAVLDCSERLTIPVGKDDNNEFLSQLGSPGFDQEAAFSKQPLLNVKLPFLMGMSRTKYVEIGGYDEDFTGIAFDDNDLVDRLQDYGCYYSEVPARAIHLWHPRGGKAHGPEYIQKWRFNKSLYEIRKGTVYRNLGREWGVFSA